MASNQYLSNRQRWARPQAVLFADNPPVFVDGKALPPGYELSSNVTNLNTTNNGFIILSDHNRDPISIAQTRFEQRQRMANGQMRSYYIGDKININLSWNLLPSRAYAINPNFAQVDGSSGLTNTDSEYTADGGAGGAEILAWHQNHRGPFWVYLSFDNFATYGYDNASYGNLADYTQFSLMYITSFNYSVEKRGANNYDMWNISMTLEEV